MNLLDYELLAGDTGKIVARSIATLATKLNMLGAATLFFSGNIVTFPTSGNMSGMDVDALLMWGLSNHDSSLRLSRSYWN
ncbi:MAG: hypothetical protein HKN50_13575 [Gammaproteobacteria bacterium]|nr:hypothetical protein [Gammaproteobacteria bacterium]